MSVFRSYPSAVVLNPLTCGVRRARIIARAFPCCAAVALSVSSGVVAAQQRSTVDSVRVNVVNVDVYVTDADGEPVAGLASEDFEVLENGQPMTISNFRAEHGPELSGAAAVDTAASTYVRPAAAARGAPQTPLWLVIYVDNLHLRPLDRTRIAASLQEYLGTSLVPTDQVMLATMGEELLVREPFTTDHPAILDSISRLGDSRAEAAKFDSEKRSLLNQITASASSFEALGHVRPHASLITRDVERSIEGLSEMVHRLAGLDGRTALLHISSGMPMIAAADMFWAVEHHFKDMVAFHRMRSWGLWFQYDELGDLANAAGVTMYTLDAGGLRGSSAGAVEIDDIASSPSVRANLSMHRNINMQEPLRFLAEQTGGEAILNRNDVLPALEGVGRNLRSYYSIGYIPDHSGDGETYSIEVSVRYPQASVRHREAYVDKAPRQRIDEGLRAALLHGYDANDLRAVLSIGESEDRGDRSFVLPFTVTVPRDELLLTDDGTRLLSSLRLFVGAMDAQGRLAPAREAPVELRPAGRALGGGSSHWQLTHHAVFPAGQYRVVVGMIDELTAATSFLTAEVQVQPQ